MKLQVFDGGLNTRLAPQHIKQTEATVYNNIHNERGILESVKLPLASGIMLNKDHVYFKANNEWVDFDVPTDSAEYQSVLYLSDGVNKPRKYKDGEFFPLGIEPPTSKLNLAPTLAPEPVNSVGLRSSGETTGTAMEIAVAYYLIVNLAANGNMSTAMYVKADFDGVTVIRTGVTDVPKPNVTTPSDTTQDLKVVFEDFSGYELTDRTEVYRFYEGDFRFVGLITDFTFGIADIVLDISGNAKFNERYPTLFGTIQYAYTYYDSTIGNESGPGPLTTELDIGENGANDVFITNFEASADAQVDSIRLYRIGNNLTNFSLVQDLGNEVISYFDQYSDTEIDGRILQTIDSGTAPVGLQFITEAYAMLWGAVGSRLYFTPIGEPNNWPALNFLNFSLDITGIAPVGSGLLVFSTYAAEIVLGTGPTSLSKQPLAGDQGCVGHKSIQLISNSAMWVSTDGICVSSGGPVQVISKPTLGKTSLIPKDSAMHDQVYYVMDFENRILAADLRYGLMHKNLTLPISQLSVGEDKLYGWDDGELLELFKSDEDAEFEYFSPAFFEGRATQSKLYKNMYFYVDGDIIIEMYIDDQLVHTKRFAGKDNFQLKIPQSDKRGAFIQFQITGTGKVHEIYWEADANDQ